MRYPSFDAFMHQFVLPLRAEHPNWTQLDGGHVSSPSTIAEFQHSGTNWEVHADTHFEPLLLAHANSATGDPFVREASHSGKRDCLCLRPDLAAAIHPNYKYLYIYGV